MARILGHSKVRRELAKLASRSARMYAAAHSPAKSEREELERAYRQGFLDGIETAERINERRSQDGR